LALDNNPNNILNNSKDIIVRQFHSNDEDISVMAYTPNLLKMWLRYLVMNPLWACTIVVAKVTTSKSGTAVYVSGDTTYMRCLNIPTDTKIDTVVAAENVMRTTAAELKKCAWILQKLLVSTNAPNAMLLIPCDIGV
jgi:hypothetical protein